MIDYKKYTLENGLRLIVHRDTSTPMAAVNVMYDVGSRDEDPKRTGFAHLFEHLMFGGSVNIPNFDEPLQRVGGQNNAFTSSDLTNYYENLPAENLDTALWLESDRMLSLAFTPKSLEVQRNVVVEEFRQRYLNQPYGDVMLHLRPLAYQQHPYQWPTIGKEISHIEEATLEDVKGFFKKHYHPGNAVLAISGNLDPDEVRDRVEHWFGDIPAQPDPGHDTPAEPEQTEKRTLTLHREVPTDALYMAFHMVGRQHPDFYAVDLLSDILGLSRSARLHQELVKEQQLFIDIDAGITANFDPGLFLIQGKLREGVDIHKAEEAVWKTLEKIQTDDIERELTKVKNKIKSALAFTEVDILNKAMNLAYYELLGDADQVNHLDELYDGVTVDDIKRVAREMLTPGNSSVLHYLKKESES